MRPYSWPSRSPRRWLLLVLMFGAVFGTSPTGHGGAARAQSLPEPEPAPPQQEPEQQKDPGGDVPAPAAPAIGEEPSGCACHRTVEAAAPYDLPAAPEIAPAPEEVQAAPADRDGDGIPDYLDKCPDMAEDKDGFQDDDGCPDPDNDGDGVPDAYDQCPNTPGPADLKGCPRVETPAQARPTEEKKVEPRRDPPPRTEPRTEVRTEPKPERQGHAVASAEQAKWVIAVMDVQAPNDPTIKKATLRGLSDQVRVFLAVRKLKVVDRGQQEAAMKGIFTDEKKKSYATCVDNACQIPLGKVLAASHILRLTISRFGDTCTTNGELIELASEVSIGAATSRSRCTDTDLLDAMERVSDDLIQSAR